MQAINETAQSLELNPFIHSEVIADASIDPIFTHILIIFALSIIVGIAFLIMMNKKKNTEDGEEKS